MCYNIVMVRDYWEFLNEEKKARVIFGVVLVAIILVVAIPYFATLLNSQRPKEAAEVDDYTEIEVANEETIVENQSEIKNDENTASESGTVNDDAEMASGEIVTAYATPTTNSSTVTPETKTTNQSAPQANSTPTRTTVDDRSAGDDGYTPSGIDDPGTEETLETNSADNGEN